MSQSAIVDLLRSCGLVLDEGESPLTRSSARLSARISHLHVAHELVLIEILDTRFRSVHEQIATSVVLERNSLAFALAAFQLMSLVLLLCFCLLGVSRTPCMGTPDAFFVSLAASWYGQCVCERLKMLCAYSYAFFLVAACVYV